MIANSKKTSVFKSMLDIDDDDDDLDMTIG